MWAGTVRAAVLPAPPAVLPDDGRPDTAVDTAVDTAADADVGPVPWPAAVGVGGLVVVGTADVGTADVETVGLCCHVCTDVCADTGAAASRPLEQPAKTVHSRTTTDAVPARHRPVGNPRP